MPLGVCPGRVCHGECESLLSFIILSSTQLSPGTEIFLIPPSLHPTYPQQTTWLPTSFQSKMAAVSCEPFPSHSPFPTPASQLSLFQPQRCISESGPVFSPRGLGSLAYILPLIIRGWLYRGKNPGDGARPARWEYHFLLSKGVTMGTLLNCFVFQFFLLKKNGINNRAYLIVLWACHE